MKCSGTLRCPPVPCQINAGAFVLGIGKYCSGVLWCPPVSVKLHRSAPVPQKNVSYTGALRYPFIEFQPSFSEKRSEKIQIQKKFKSHYFPQKCSDHFEFLYTTHFYCNLVRFFSKHIFLTFFHVFF